MNLFSRQTSAEYVNANCYAFFRAKFPNDLSKIFIEIEDGAPYTFGDLESISGRFARCFENLNLKLGDRIIAQVDASPEAIFLYAACLRYGAIFIPLDTALQIAELKHIIQDAEPALIICRPSDERKMTELVQVEKKIPIRTLDQFNGGSLMSESEYLPPRTEICIVTSDHVACILYTSGTTGRAKGVMLTHGNFRSNSPALSTVWNFKHNDIVFYKLGIAHIAYINIVNLCLFSSCRILLNVNTEEGSAVRNLPKATVFFAGPGGYTELLAQGESAKSLCRNLRLCVFMAAPIREEMEREFMARTGKVITQRYGTTETAIVASNPIGGSKVGSAGKVLPEVTVRITDESGSVVGVGVVGNIEVRGPNVFKGYWNDLEKTRESFHDDFFISGDLGKIDEEGYLWVLGREKDMIVVGGAKVYPKEVESYIDNIPGVEESAVFGVNRPNFGEYVIAVVKKKSPSLELSEDMISSALNEQIARYKIPQKFFFIDEIPRGDTGKVQKNVLRELYKTAFDSVRL